MKIVYSITTVCLSIMVSYAQGDYSKQIKALKMSFSLKNSEAIKPYVSDSLSFGTYPAGATVQILGQVFNNLPKLKSLDILSQKNGEAEVQYDFQVLGKRTSKILFDEVGKITKLYLVDNLLKEQAEAQAAMARQKQAPTPGPLAEKYMPKLVSFKAKDGLEVTGNLYEVGINKPLILLCHQANYNKYEYSDIAPKLNEMGYNVLAIDQRSGGSFADHDNTTFQKAKLEDKATGFLNAEQDIEAAIDFLNKRFGSRVILWGSSYSSSLALFIAERNEHVRAVISFSPGDYFGDAKPSLQEVFMTLDKPFLVTSSKEESNALEGLLEGVSRNKDQKHFIPKGIGFHGSRALWEGQEGGEEYWSEVVSFLRSLR